MTACSAQHLVNVFDVRVVLMRVMVRAGGHDHLNRFDADELVTWKKTMANPIGMSSGGVA